jgi:hypothetical protein
VLLLFAHGLTVARGGARDCVGVWPDTEDGMKAAMRHAEEVPGVEGLPVGEEWCGIYRAVPGRRLQLVYLRRQPALWEDRWGEPCPVEPYD